MPADRPDAMELIEAAAEFLAARARPALAEPEAFEALVAANLLAIARRELELGTAARGEELRRLRELVGREGEVEELEAELVGLIRDGDLDPVRERVIAHLRATARARLRIANPDYLTEA